LGKVDIKRIPIKESDICKKKKCFLDLWVRDELRERFKNNHFVTFDEAALLAKRYNVKECQVTNFFISERRKVSLIMNAITSLLSIRHCP
jgi:phosphopantetheinyl transferase (holo-ACP synthase)